MSVYLGKDKVSITGYIEKGIEPTGEIEITENGRFDVKDFASALVNVSGGDGISLFEKIYTFTPTSITHEVVIPYSLPTQYMILILPQMIPQKNKNQYEMLAYFAKVPFSSSSQWASLLLSKTSGVATGALAVNGNIVSDSYGIFDPNYTYDVYFCDLTEV